MIISKKNPFVRIYQAMYIGEELPRSICPLFWKVFVGIFLTITSPLIIVVGIIRKLLKQPFYVHDEYEGSLFIDFLVDKLGIILWVMSIAVIYARKGVDFFSLEWYKYILAPIIFISIVLTIIVIIGLFIALYEHIEHKIRINRYKQKEESVAIQGIKAFWNKICPIIEYKD